MGFSGIFNLERSLLDLRDSSILVNIRVTVRVVVILTLKFTATKKNGLLPVPIYVIARERALEPHWNSSRTALLPSVENANSVIEILCSNYP